MKTLYVKDLQKNQVFEKETFAIFETKKMEDKNNRPYYNLIIGDKTGKLNAKIWSDSIPNCDTNAIKDGRVVRISGKVDSYKNHMQITILYLEGVDEESVEEFIESSQFDPDEMFEELLEEIGSIKSNAIKTVLLDIVNDKDINRRLKFWPAANTIHHSIRSGLLQHILEMFAIAKGLERFYADVNFDVLKAGIIMHDLGKIYELDGNDISIPYTKVGYLLGHIYLGAEMFTKFGKEKLPEDIFLHIMHLIISHHGSYEYGSPVLPATTEALLLTYIDDTSAKARTADAIKKSMGEDEEFSNRVLWLQNVKIWNFKTPKDDDEQDSSAQQLNLVP